MSKPNDQQTAEELANVTAEPLLPIEKQLIVGSISLGLVLLVVLYFVVKNVK
jgi:hypothetical protein